jgi:4-amino-4-deoxy-L-arabinose transferase-like glycosyltransferase
MGVCIALPLVFYLIVSGGWKQIVPLLPTAVPGLVVMLAMFLPWFYYMGKLFPSVAEGIFSYQVSERAIGTGGWSPAMPWFYIMPMIVYLLPWLAFIPGAFAVPLMARFRDHRRPLVYLFLWTVGLVGLFTAAAGKREHYILPIYPAMCLLMGFLAEDMFFNHAWIKPALARLIGVGYGLAAPASVIAIFMASKQRDQRLHLAVVVAMATAPMLLAGLAAVRNRLRPIVGLIVLSITLVYVGFNFRADLWDQYATIKSFARDAAVIIAQDARREGLNPDKVLVYHWGDPETQLPFYFGQFIPSVRWQFDRQQDQWVREGMDSKQAKDRIDQQWSQWIAEPSNAPWLIDSEKLYSDKSGTRRNPLHTDELQCLGYQVVMIRTEKARKSHQFTLYRRSGSTATIPASLPSIPEQDQQQE